MRRVAGGELADLRRPSSCRAGGRRSPVEAETATSLPSGETAMWSERWPVTWKRHLISPVSGPGEVKRDDVPEARSRDDEELAVGGRVHVVDELVVALADELADRRGSSRGRLGFVQISVDPLVVVGDDVDARERLELVALGRDDVRRALPVVADEDDLALGVAGPGLARVGGVRERVGGAVSSGRQGGSTPALALPPSPRATSAVAATSPKTTATSVAIRAAPLSPATPSARTVSRAHQDARKSTDCGGFGQFRRSCGWDPSGSRRAGSCTPPLPSGARDFDQSVQER